MDEAEPLTYKRAMQNGRAANQKGSSTEARQHFERALALAERDAERAEALGLIARAFSTQGDYARAEAVLHEAEPYAQGDERMQAMLLMHHGAISWQSGRMQDSRRALEAAQLRFKQLNLISERMITLINLGVTLRGEGEYQHALDVYQEALELAESLQDVPRIITALNNRAQCCVEVGLWQVAESSLNRCLEISAELDLVPATATVYINLARIYENEARFDDALKALTRAIEVSRKYEMRYIERQALGQLGALHVTRGAFDEAERAAHAMVALDAAAQNLAEAELILGRCALARGDQQAALQILSQGMLNAEVSFSKVLALQFHAALGQLVGQPAIAAVHREMARTQIQLIRDGLRDKSTQAAFENTPLVRSVLGTG